MAGRQLTPGQEMFVFEYLLDFNERRAAKACGFTATMGKRLLSSPRVVELIDAERAARRDRLRVDADRVTEEFAKVAYANARDYWPKPGEKLDIHRLDADRTAAIEELNIFEALGHDGKPKSRETKLRLHDKIAALNSLAKSVGMMTERHVHELSIETKVVNMTPQERQELARELLIEAQKYLPAYQAAIEAGEIEIVPEESGDA